MNNFESNFSKMKMCNFLSCLLKKLEKKLFHKKINSNRNGFNASQILKIFNLLLLHKEQTLILENKMFKQKVTTFAEHGFL